MTFKILTAKSRIAPLLAVVLMLPAMAWGQGYGGPSMLSRGGNRPGQRGRAPVNLNVYAGVRGSMETGLTRVSVDEDGTVPAQRTYGGQLELGAYGGHAWQRTMVGADYRGDYRTSTRQKAFNGFNHAASLDIQSQVTDRLTLFGRETAGTTNRAFGGFAGPALPSLNNFAVPTEELFDTRVYYSQTSAGASYRLSGRTTLIGTGDYFFTKRPNTALVGAQGSRASGTWQYAISRRTTVGAVYQYIRYRYPRAFGGADGHGIAGAIMRSVTRSFTINASGGAMYVQLYGTQRVTLSPEVAAILGRGSGVEAFYRTRYVPQVSVSGTYTLERSNVTVGAQTAVLPGNGVYLTTRRDSVHAGDSYAGVRRMSIGASTAYSRLHSLGTELGDARLFRIGTGMNYNIGGGLNFSAQFDRRWFSSPGVRGRQGYSLSAGLTYSPARLPLPIW